MPRRWRRGGAAAMRVSRDHEVVVRMPLTRGLASRIYSTRLGALAALLSNCY
jgi:hypothetical protein